METIIIDGFDFTNMDAQNYYSFTSAFKGNKAEKARELCLSEKYLGSRKMDGSWNMLIKDMDGKFHLRSRKESVNGGFTDKAEWIPQICKNLAAVPNGTVFIGEIYFPNNEGSRKITSVLNCLKDKCLDRQKKGEYLHYYIFDVVAWNGKSMIETEFADRISYLTQPSLQNLEYVDLAQYVRGQALLDLWSSVIEAGGEGIVITREDCHYLCGKRTAWMTLKMKKELAEPIDCFVDGDYKPANRLYDGNSMETWAYWENYKTGEKFDTCQIEAYRNGVPVEPVKKPYFFGWASSISLSVMRDGKPFHVAWLSNITDEFKRDIIKAPEKYINKVVQVNAMQIEHIDGNYSIRHGRIETWRDDKNPEDCQYSQFID